MTDIYPGSGEEQNDVDYFGEIGLASAVEQLVGAIDFSSTIEPKYAAQLAEYLALMQGRGNTAGAYINFVTGLVEKKAKKSSKYKEGSADQALEIRLHVENLLHVVCHIALPAYRDKIIDRNKDFGSPLEQRLRMLNGALNDKIG